MVLVSGAGIAWAFHKALTFHVIFAQAVYYDMDVYVAAAVLAVHVGANKGLVAREILCGIFQPKLLRTFSGQAAFFFVSWVKADDVVVCFDFVIALVFVAVCV